jgi:Flp pilus assembly protein TadD
LLANCYSHQGRTDDAKREADLAMALRPDDTMILYNVACVFCLMGMKQEGLDALKRAKETGYRSPTWVRQDPDLALLHGDPEFDELYPAAESLR